MVEKTPLNSKYNVKDFVKMLNETEYKVNCMHNLANYLAQDDEKYVVKLNVDRS